MRTKRWLKCIVTLVTVGATTAAWTQAEMLPAGVFSALKPGAALPEPWKPLRVSSSKNLTRYSLVDDGGVTVVRAESTAAASGLSRVISVSPADFPILAWRWKISNTLKSSDIRTRVGDDYPARVYVMFDYPLEKLSFAQRAKLRLARALHDPHLPAATLCYVWDDKAPA